MNFQPYHIYEFGPFKMDIVERLLLRDGEAVPLQPKVFDLLRVLVQNHGHLLEKNDLMKAVWPDSIVEEANLPNNISILRKLLDRGLRGECFIKTVPKRGYRFVAPVRETALGAGSVAVLPFKALNQAENDETFGLGMADAIITRLSGLNQYIIRPTSAVREYTNPRQDPVAVGRKLKVDFVLEGIYQKSEDRLRVTAQLISVQEGTPRWSEKFDVELADIFTIQDSISEQMVEELTLQLEKIRDYTYETNEMKRNKRKMEVT